MPFEPAAEYPAAATTEVHCKAWDISGTFDYMPKQYLTFRWEFNHRVSNVPYFSEPGGIRCAGEDVVSVSE